MCIKPALVCWLIVKSWLFPFVFLETVSEIKRSLPSTLIKDAVDLESRSCAMYSYFAITLPFCRSLLLISKVSFEDKNYNEEMSFQLVYDNYLQPKSKQKSSMFVFSNDITSKDWE